MRKPGREENLADSPVRYFGWHDEHLRRLLATNVSAPAAAWTETHRSTCSRPRPVQSRRTRLVPRSSKPYPRYLKMLYIICGEIYNNRAALVQW